MKALKSQTNALNLSFCGEHGTQLYPRKPTLAQLYRRNVALSLMAIVTLLLSMNCYANVFDIKPTEDLAMVAKGLKPGDTLRLGKGSYYSSTTITLKSGITIEGMGKKKTVVFIKSSISAGVKVESENHIKLKAFSIKMDPESESYGIQMTNVTNVSIDSVAISDSPMRAIFIKEAKKVHIINVSVVNVGKSHAPSSKRQGIVLSKVNDAIIADCDISNAGETGVFIFKSKNINVDNVLVKNSRGGIGLYGSKFVIVRGSTVIGCTGDHGMGVDDNTTNTTFINNTVIDGKRFGFFADRNSDNNIFILNTIRNNSSGGGLLTKECDNNTIVGNVIANNGVNGKGWGLYIKGNRNIIYGNKFAGNSGGDVFFSKASVESVVSDF